MERTGLVRREELDRDEVEEAAPQPGPPELRLAVQAGQVPDVDLSPKSGPKVLLQLGKLLGGDTSESTWISRSDPKGVFPKPGVSLTLVTESADIPPTPSFRAKLDLVSIGIDVQGAASKPLVTVKGVTPKVKSARLSVTGPWVDNRYSPGARLQMRNFPSAPALPADPGLSPRENTASLRKIVKSSLVGAAVAALITPSAQ